MNWVLFRFKLVNTRLQRYLVRAHIESRACWTPGPERPWPVRARRLEFVAFMEENRTWFTISKTILDMLTMDERVKSFLLERVPAEVQYLKKKKNSRQLSWIISWSWHQVAKSYLSLFAEKKKRNSHILLFCILVSNVVLVVSLWCVGRFERLVFFSVFSEVWSWRKLC
jgi:hypothetical protein